jgi:hypothetical protein
MALELILTLKKRLFFAAYHKRPTAKIPSGEKGMEGQRLEPSCYGDTTQRFGCKDFLAFYGGSVFPLEAKVR